VRGQFVCPSQLYILDTARGSTRTLSKYDLSTESHLHGWPPKLAARYFNMNLNNTDKLYYTVEKGYDFWLCHTTKKINGKQKVVSCHLRYHSEMYFSSTGTATESSVASDLTEE
jgi:hypothetical protein